MREWHNIALDVDKRGRARGFLGWLRGHPWARRRLEVNITYTSSTLQYFKNESVLRDLIDLVGSSTNRLKNTDPLLENRENGIEITLASRENLYLACASPAEQDKLMKALEHAGKAPTLVDSVAQQMKLNVLRKDHERALYSYFEFKGNELPNGLDKRFNPTAKGVITLELLNRWEALLEETFPKIYSKSSETAQAEDLYSQEFKRKIEMHEAEAKQSRHYGADQALAKQKLDEDIFQDKVVYVMEKEARMLEEVAVLVSRYV
jgi:hypothetical protein